ncbi:MAG: hypothetical protein WBV85_14675 [Solirubrobacteraceae bacterium]
MDEPNASGSRATTETQPAAGAGAQPSEEDLRAAYEAELNRISSSDLILQTTVSLINIGGRRLGLTAPGAAPAESESDLEQVRDAIDGARALMPILERHMPNELGPMRDAISQLQMAYAREAQSGAGAAPAATSPSSSSSSPPSPSPSEPVQPGGDAGPGTPADKEGEAPTSPGPAQSSGRLWVPGR